MWFALIIATILFVNIGVSLDIWCMNRPVPYCSDQNITCGHTVDICNMHCVSTTTQRSCENSILDASNLTNGVLNVYASVGDYQLRNSYIKCPKKR